MRFDHHHHQHHHRHGHHHGSRPFEHGEQRGEGKEQFYRHRGDDPRGGWGGGRGEGRRRFFERGEFKFALLELLASAPMHGYQLIKAMEERSGGLYTPSAGSVYPNLQLLEDMNLIGSTEADGKKLYHITEGGREQLRARGQRGEGRPEDRWERRGPHRPDGGGRGKQELREFMKEWSDVVFLMAEAARSAQADPSSGQAARFRELMAKLRQELQQRPDASGDAGADAEPDGPTPPEGR